MITQNKVNEFARGADVLCLHALAQPLVHELQEAVRFQARQLSSCIDALEYVLNRIARDEDMRRMAGVGTETYAKLTSVAAEITGDDVDYLRERFIPGSADIHRSREEAE